MADLVASVLQDAAEREAKLKSIEVVKDIDLDVDEGNLLTVDQNPLELKEFRANKEEFLKNLARDNSQILFNRIWELPIERVQEAVVAKLPDPKTILPREKPIPKEKRLTKWEQYAKLKGIQNTKKGRMVWDEELKEYRPRWGYKRANDEMRDWAIEVPDNANPLEDQFEKRVKAKKERIAKNELQRLRNIARTSKKKVPGVGLTPTDKPDKDQLKRALVEAGRSNASLGKFMNKLPKEKPVTGMGKKRKFQSNTADVGVEKKQALEVLRRIQSSKPTINATAAGNRLIGEEQRQRANSRKKMGKPQAGGAGGKKRGSQRGSEKGGKKGRTQTGSSKGGKKGNMKGGKRKRGQ